METTSIAQQIDAYIDHLFAGWNIYSTLLAVALAAYLFSPLFFGAEPDIHPMLLARQAAAAPVRQSGESAIYRSLEVPHGYPLRTGLNVKEPGAPQWTAGKDGDLRDVWRKAIANIVTGLTSGKAVISVRGRDEILRHNLEDLSKEINIVGIHLSKQRTSRVAIYLPNSVELLVTFFAAAFYGFTPILIPPGLSPEVVARILTETKADSIIAAAGTLPIDGIATVASVSNIVWVVEKTSRHMDFMENAEGRIHTSQWHEVINGNIQKGSADLPALPLEGGGPNIVSVQVQHLSGEYEIVEYSQKNIVAAVAAQLAALPRGHTVEPSDLVLPLESLSSMYPLTISLAVLYSGASIALTSVAGPTADYDLAFQQGLSPSMIVASAKTMQKALERRKAQSTGIIARIAHQHRSRELTAGAMGKSAKSPMRSSPRLIYISEHADPSHTPLLNTQDLNDIRIFTNARIIYALTVARVAGAVAQTHMLDYRIIGIQGRTSHFGAPVSAVEIKLVETPQARVSDDAVQGELVITGPAVVNRSTNTGILSRILDDNTLAISLK